VTKKTRTILFLSFLTLFLLLAPAIVLYSQGYRFDLENKKLSQTGGLFLKVLPKQAEVYLDDKLSKKTDFFFGSVLIENLLPQKYKIRVRKEGFYAWEKNLEIKEKQVAEAKNIILFPENPKFSVLFSEVEKFWFSPDQKKLVLLENDVQSNPWALKLYETEKKIKTHLIYETDISSQGADLIFVEFSPDAKKISLEAGVREQLRYYEIDLDRTPATITRKEDPLLPLENIIAHLKEGNEIYYLDAFGYLYKSDLSLEMKEKINEIPFPLIPETEYKVIKLNDLLFLQKEKSVYKLDSSSKSFEAFSEGINDLKLSPDSRKLLYFSDYEIWLLSLEDELPLHKAGDKTMLLRLSEKIKDCSWLNSNYLVFTTEDKVKISETDDRDRTNIVDIKQTKNPDIFWNKIEKKLYLLEEKKLSVSDPLLP